jgi:hypothetical protein
LIAVVVATEMQIYISALNGIETHETTSYSHYDHISFMVLMINLSVLLELRFLCLKPEENEYFLIK